MSNKKLTIGLVFGGSWGATLALIYAQKFPKRVNNLLLRGVFLMTQPELQWFYGGGAGQFWPDVWKKFKDPIPIEDLMLPVKTPPASVIPKCKG